MVQEGDIFQGISIQCKSSQRKAILANKRGRYIGGINCEEDDRSTYEEKDEGAIRG